MDAVTGQFNLHRIVNFLSFQQFPAESPPLAAYFQLYDGIGQYDLSMELRDLAGDTSVAAEIFSHLDFPERLVKMELVLPIDSLRLPRVGRYQIAILFDGREVATQFIDAEDDNGPGT